MPHRYGDSLVRNHGWSLLIIMAGLLSPPPAHAVPFDGKPKILLHLRATTTKNACNAGLLSDCTAAVTAGSIISGPGPYYFVYVLAARGSMLDMAGAQFGVTYQDGNPAARLDGHRLDIFSWVNCAALQFVTGNWPDPGTGNLVTWDATATCQTGETGVVGYFYLGAYAADQLKLIPRPSDGRAKLANCGAIETLLDVPDLGRVEFTSGAMTAGCNPCVEACGPPTGPDTMPPNAVSLNLLARTSESVTLSWLAPDEDGATGHGERAIAYDLRRSFFPITEGNFLAATPITPVPLPVDAGEAQQKIVTSLATGTTYHFAMRSVDDAGNWSPVSNSLEATTLTPGDQTPPSAVTDLAIADVTASSFLVTWTAPGDDGQVGTAASYDIRYSLSPITSGNFTAATAAPGPPAPSPAGSNESYLLPGLEYDTRYYVALRSVDDRTNVSGLSNVVTAITLAVVPPDSTPPDSIPPAPITNLVVTNYSGSTVTLGWTAPGDDDMTGRATVYDLRRSTSPITAANFLSAAVVTGEPLPGPPGTTEAMTVGGLTHNTRYYFALRTGDEKLNWSTISNVVDQRTSSGIGDPRLMLHVTAPVSKSACLNGELDDCDDAVTRGNLAAAGGGGPYYFVYLMAIQFEELSGIQCGIDYDQNRIDGRNNHERIDIVSWTLCASLNFQSGSPRPWPAPGSGNLITWDATTRCQTGATAVAGYFYVAAYSPDILSIIPRPADAVAKAADCASVERVITPTFLGTARFSDDPNLQGYNPCGAGHEVPVERTTWSRIKTLTAG